ncbi:hypothetical protein Pla123a_36630 [Posidoniimonas polymericola]|uniref:PEP-CTERM protein-sorting domain-containing protein n=1 Tax=Posidoniimonas polymericola TaxID=2528002 RepID=A0A5C5YFN7_9BACT|nr:hypothetical protein [Posidoniimonas polymericola]TWT73769.1 hypothetical protein Pla123a_36630 [Posidoniimonas polymericola]
MKLKSLFGVCALSVVMLVGSQASAMLKVDFNHGGSPTEAGYYGVGVGGATGLNGGAVGASIDLSLTAVGGTLDSRNRTFGPIPEDLSRDFVFTTTGTSSAGDYLDILLKNVTAGTYTFTGFFHNSELASPVGAYEDAETNVSFANGASPAPGDFIFGASGVRTDYDEEPIGEASFNFVSTGEDLTFRIGLADSSKRAVLINGFTLAAVPEVGSFFVGSLLFGVGMARYRGKRRA